MCKTAARSDKHTANLKMTLAGEPFRERILERVLHGAVYDAVILDCAPSIDVLYLAALADWSSTGVYFNLVGVGSHAAEGGEGR